MKKSILALALVSAFSSAAFARSNKICFGSTKSDDTKGNIVKIEFDRQSVTFTKVKGETYEGTYATTSTTTAGHDGKTYLEYKGEDSDQQDIIMIDEELLHKGTTGLLQFRSRGEGFFNSVYVCKDDKK